MRMIEHYNNGFDARLEGLFRIHNPWNAASNPAEFLQWERGWLDCEAMLRLMGDKRADQGGPSDHHR